MVAWRALVTIFKCTSLCWLTLFAFTNAFAENDDIGEATQNKGDLSQRLTFAIRYNLIHQKNNEAWRLTELATRAEIKVSQLDYYHNLAMLRRNVCVLGQDFGSDSPASWKELARAHIFRFGVRYSLGGFNSSPFATAEHRPMPNFLGAQQTHFLGDIAKAELIPGTGCRMFATLLADRQKSQTAEFTALLRWYQLQTNNSEDVPLIGAQIAELRLLDLATKEKEIAIAGEIIEHFAAQNTTAWLDTPDPERRYIFNKLIELEKFSKPPYALVQKPNESTTKESELVLAIIFGTKTSDAAYWVGLFDPNQLGTHQEKLFNHLLEIPNITEKPYLLARMAELSGARGDIPGSLHYVYRLLLGGESEGNTEIEQFAGLLATDLFAEFRYDEAMLGAIQSSLPSGQWKAVLRRLLIDNSWWGDRKGFEMIKKLAAKINRGGASETSSNRPQNDFIGFSKEENVLLQALCQRQSTAFKNALSQFNKGTTLNGRGLSFLSELASRSLSLSESERTAAKPFLDAVGDFLRAHLNQNSAQQQLLQLMGIFGTGTNNRFNAGVNTASSGSVVVGVANISKRPALAYPFSWSAPKELPRRNLLVMPKSVDGFDWIIE